MPQQLDQNGRVVPGSFKPKFGYGQSVAYTGTAGTIATELSTIKATGTLTSTGVAPADGVTVTIGNKVYTFKTTLTPTEGEVLINTTAAAALTNLYRAITHTGTPDTDYSCAAAHTQVTVASAPSATVLVVTALVGGIAANDYALAESSATLSWAAAFLTGGVANARNTTFVQVMCTTAAFVRIGASPTAVAGDYVMAANVPQILPCVAGDKVSAVQVASGGTLYVIELD